MPVHANVGVVPHLSHRLQVLVDDERYRRLRLESQRTGAPIGAIVRDAIDSRLAAAQDPEPGAAAAGRLLAAAPMAVSDWKEMKHQMLEELHGPPEAGDR